MNCKVLNISVFANNDEIARTLNDATELRDKTLDVCYSVPEYKALPLKLKNQMYDFIKGQLLLKGNEIILDDLI